MPRMDFRREAVSIVESVLEYEARAKTPEEKRSVTHNGANHAEQELNKAYELGRAHGRGEQGQR